MPLPDERPRQSVANLIGRFENQTKRQAPTNGPPPRSSSVVSHNTGDSMNNEQKEKREWPPKSISERIASLESFPVRPRPPLPASHSAPQPSTASMLIERLVSSVPSTIPPVDDPKPVIKVEAKVETKADADNAAAPVADPPPPSSQTHKSTVVVAKGSPSIASKSAPRTNSKSSAPRHSSGAPVVQPLKPQHSGLSTASASVRKPTSPTRAARSTATSAAITRPKTPSSGLFAPTAASLAKSRNAAATSAPTTPVKKSTISSSASDRLSKPTAASLSRARTPVPPLPQSTRSNTKSVATTRTPKAISTSTSAKKLPSVKKPTAPTKPHTSDHTPHDTSSDVVASPDVVDNHEPVNGHTLELHSEDVIPLEEASGQGSEPAESEEREAEIYSDKTMEDVRPETDGDSSMDLANERSPGSPSEVLAEAHVGVFTEQPIFEQESKIGPGDDIENLVNLLESASIRKDRPVSITSIPDEVHEIPDEE